MKFSLTGVQQLGRALMLPIAVLPVAGILLRIGQPDLLNLPFVAAAGAAIFDHLGLLFAIGVAVGFARENHGAAGLAGAVGYFVAAEGAKVMIVVPPEALADFAENAHALASAAFKNSAISKLSIPIGILSGLIAGALYNRFGDIRLPEYLAFFGGRRFVPIASGVCGLLLAVIFGLGWPYANTALDQLSRAVLGAGELGLFAYGLLNRLLLVTGLHHILNNVAWFILGEYGGATGDLKRFFAGDPTAGAFMSGFFPVMMFGLPAACLAMYHAARADKRKAVGGMLLSMALTSFLTGVTEPIEFTFMFLAPVLYVLHAILTGLGMVIMDMLNVKLGFGFSAGAFDYVLNFSKATNPLLLIPVGIGYFIAYYAAFRVAIHVFKLPTPGREDDDATEATSEASAALATDDKTTAMIMALGGSDNLLKVDACTTRLRLTVRSGDVIDTARLKDLGARGVVRPSADAVQVVLGPQAEQVAGDIRKRMAQGPVAAGKPSASAPVGSSVQTFVAEASYPLPDPAGVLKALGGREALKSVKVASSRLCVTLVQGYQPDAAALTALGVRGLVQTGPDRWQIVIGPQAAVLAERLTSDPVA
ncbi:MAG: N-acetylglucosamine-specific PTS transporter subunit IIBC [Asticcacaulis sp.]